MVSRSLLVALGWSLIQGQIQFSILITREQGFHPIWFPATLFITIQASLLLEGIEQTLRCWLISLLLSIVMAFVLLSFPMSFGLEVTELIPIILLSNIRSIMSVLIVIAPIGLLGCFIGQMLRNRLL